MKRKTIILILLTILIILTSVCAVCFYSIKRHTFILSDDSCIKTEQIQPVSGKVFVSGTLDTSVSFTDVETGKKYEIGYITPGMGASIELEKGKWYIVEGNGSLTLKLVNVRIE